MIDPVRFARLLTGYCLEVQPGQQIVVRASTLAAPLVLELQRAILEAGAWPLLRVELPGQAAGFYTHAQDAHLDGHAPLALTEATEADASIADPGAGEHACAGRHRPGAARAGGPRSASRSGWPPSSGGGA